MAKELEEFPVTWSRQKGQNKYPLDEWLNGKVYQLDLGEDFDCKPENLRASLSKSARDRGGKLRTAIINDKKSLVVQFMKESGGS